MTAPTTDAPAVDIPEGAAPIRLPVMVVEGMETADGRFIEPGALQVRTLPIGLYSQVKSTHGSLQGDAATVLVGAITQATRRPGPEVQQLSTGEMFPEGTFVWEGTGWMYKDVPAPPDKSAYVLVKDKALRGNSVDLSDVDAEFEYADGQDMAADPHPSRIVITSGFIGATTLVGQPAFPDAFIEIDGLAVAGDIVEGDVLSASVTPMWLSSETGDQCAPCRAIPGPHDAALLAAIGPDLVSVDSLLILEGADIEPDEITPRHTGGMLALVPANPNMLRVPGGDPAEELHLTLAYLGDNVTDWAPEEVEAAHRVALEATNFDAMVARIRAEEEATGGDMQPVRNLKEMGREPAQKGPLTGGIFSHAIFNPNGDNGHDPATVYLLDGSEDRPHIDGLAESVQYRMRDAIGTTQFPEQHRPYVPHVTAGYGVPVEALTYTGPVEFSHLRVALGDDVTDYPLGGGEALVAGAGAALPDADWFANPGLTEPTPLTVGQMTPAGAPVFGHLCLWNTCHIGFAGKCVTPPRSASAYAYFMVHSTQALQDGDTQTTIPVGYGTIGTGHADVRRDAMAAAEHYDNTGTVAFEYTVGEDEHGVWFAGRLLPGLSEETEAKARGTVFSGDWRTIRGRLELVASLGVNVPGFPVPRVRVASGQPVALVAGGVLTEYPRDETGAETVTAAGVLGISRKELTELLGYIRAEKDGKDTASNLDAIAELTEGADLANALIVAGFLADIELATEGGHPWFSESLDDPEKEEGSDDAGWDGFAKKNWVAKAGGLPEFIKRISKHLRDKGMTESRAIATAVNAAKKMCSTGDTSLPGRQSVNAGSRAEACAAVAEWERKKAQS